MATTLCSVATTLSVCLFILIHVAGCEARATHSHCAPACHCYQQDGLRAANCSSLHNISSIAHSVEVLRVEEFGDHLSLKDGLFSPLVNLKRLHLSHLGLHKVYPAAFSGLRQLQVLDLSHNRFAAPSELAKAVNQLPQLERVLLRGNPLGKVPLLSSKQLAFLDLGSCKISNISDSSLKNLSGLKHLKLDNNRLTVIKPKWLPQSIVSLDLSNNYIRHFSRHEFQNLSHLQHVEISGNPIHCTCETLKIRYDFIMNNVVLCVYPKEYRGVDLFSLKKRDFCPKTDSDNRIRRQVADDEEYEDEDDYYNDEGDDEKPSEQDVPETEQGNEGSAKSDASKPEESGGVHTHSSEHVHDTPPLAADSPSHDEDKEQEDVDTFPASEEDKEVGESALDDTSAKNEHSDAAASADDEDKSKEDIDKSPAKEEENDGEESVVNDMSNKNEHDDFVPDDSADDGDKDEETENSPANEEEKHDAEIAIEDNKSADADLHTSNDDENREEGDNISPANEEEKDDAESALGVASVKNDHVDSAAHASADDGNNAEDANNSPADEDNNSSQDNVSKILAEDGDKDKEDADNSPANEEEKDDAESAIDDNKDQNADAAPHVSEGVGVHEEEEDTNNSQASVEKTGEAEDEVDEASNKHEHLDMVVHLSPDDENKDEEDTDKSPASVEKTGEAEDEVDETSDKHEHLDMVVHLSPDDENKDEEDTDTSPASVEKAGEAEDEVDETSDKHEHLDMVLHLSPDDENKDEEDTDKSPASVEKTGEAEDEVDETSDKHEHLDMVLHLSPDDENKDEEDTDKSPASVEKTGETEDEVDETSDKHEHLDMVLHLSPDDENKDEENTDSHPASEEVKEMVGTALDDTSNNEPVDTAEHSSEGNKDDLGDEKEEAVNVSDSISAHSEHKDIAPHSAAAEKEEDTTNSEEEVKHEHVVSTLDESSAQNEDHDVAPHVSGSDSLAEENKDDGTEDKDELKESDDENKSEDLKEEEAISEVKEHASHASAVGETEPKENDETGEEVDDSLNELSKEDVAGNPFESSGEVEKEDESKGQEESETHTSSDTHGLLSPDSASQNETSASEEDHSSRMVVFGSDEDQVDHDTEVDELHNISSNEHKPQDSEDGGVEDNVDEEENTDTEVDELHNISSQKHKAEDSEDGGVEDNVDDEEEQGLHEHHEIHAIERNETHTSASTEDDKDVDDLMKWDSDSVVEESQEKGEDYAEEGIENHNEFFALHPTSENATEPSVEINETHSAVERNETDIFMDTYEEAVSESSKAAYDLSEELEDVSGKHDYMFEEIEGSGSHEDSTPILLEGSGFEDSVTESSTEDTSESSGYAPLFIGVHSVLHTSHQVENESRVVDESEKTTVNPPADNSLELEEESSGHGSLEEIPIIPPVEGHDHDSAVTTEKEPVVEEEVVHQVNVHHVEATGPPVFQTTTRQPEMEETSTQKPAEVEIESGSGANETHGDIRQDSDGEKIVVQDSARNSAGSYIVLGVIMCIIVILLAYAVIRSHQKRKRSPRKDVENPGRELQDVSKPLIDSKPPPSKEGPVDETREPLMSKEKEAALSSEQPDNEPVKNGDLKHVPEVVVEKQPLTETDSPAPAQNKDANGTAKKPEPNGTLTAPLVNGNGVAAPVSPNSGRVKVVAKELPDSVAKRPILIVNRGTDPTV